MNEIKETISKKNTLTPLILGILSIPGALITPILGIILAVVGLILSFKGLRHSTMAKIGLILCIIGIILSIVNGVLGAMLFHHAYEVSKITK